MLSSGIAAGLQRMAVVTAQMETTNLVRLVLVYAHNSGAESPWLV